MRTAEMITPAAIAAKAERLYVPYLRAWLTGEPFWPRAFPVGKLPEAYVDLRAGVAKLLRGAKSPGGAGYAVELRPHETRRHGAQSLPVRIVFEGEGDLLCVIGKAAEFAAFQSDVALIRARLPALGEWLARGPEQVIAHHGAWPDLLLVCAYFLEHPRPDCYIRELPVAVHAKFVETHTGILRRLLDALLPPEAVAPAETMFERRYGLRYDEPLVRLRFLDDALRERLDLPLADISAPLSQVATLPLGGVRCVIAENKLTFLTLPPLRDTFAIFGGGFGVEVLAGLDWLAAGTVLYWGDLDAQGFQILSRLRASFPHVVAVMMDAATFDAFAEFAVPGTPCAVTALPHLTPEELALFARLASDGLRLEQERIPYAHAVARLRELTPPGCAD